MKNMTRFLTLAFALSAFNTRASQEPFIVSENWVKIGTAAAGLTGAGIGYCLMEDYQSSSLPTGKQTSKFKNLLLAVPVAGVSALLVYKWLDSYTPVSWYKHAEKQAAGVQGVAARYGVTSGDAGVNAAQLIDKINLENSRKEYPLVAGVKHMQDAVGAAEQLRGIISAVGAADPNLTDLVGKLGETTAWHNAGLNRAIVTARADATYLQQQDLQQRAEEAAKARAIEAQKAAAQEGQAAAQRAQARALQQRADAATAAENRKRGF